MPQTTAAASSLTGREAQEAQAEHDEQVRRALAELRQRFVGLGCTARAVDFASLLPTLRPEYVEEALHRLAQEGTADLDVLSDGALVFHFPR